MAYELNKALRLISSGKPNTIYTLALDTPATPGGVSIASPSDTHQADWELLTIWSSTFSVQVIWNFLVLSTRSSS
ncbi:MAG: hypothetical protein AAF298_04720 [Cyanobacteria bacterium P01_A01_bin.40]